MLLAAPRPLPTHSDARCSPARCPACATVVPAAHPPHSGVFCSLAGARCSPATLRHIHMHVQFTVGLAAHLSAAHLAIGARCSPFRCPPCGTVVLTAHSPAACPSLLHNGAPLLTRPLPASHQCCVAVLITSFDGAGGPGLGSRLVLFFFFFFRQR